MTARHTIVYSFIASIELVGTALAQTPYDGVWDVIVLTKAGSCEPSAPCGGLEIQRSKPPDDRPREQLAVPGRLHDRQAVSRQIA